MGRANSRAIAHGYRLSSTESSPTESRILPRVFYPANPPTLRETFFIPITSNCHIAGNGESYSAIATRNFAFEVCTDFRCYQEHKSINSVLRRYPLEKRRAINEKSYIAENIRKGCTENKLRENDWKVNYRESADLNLSLICR